MAVSYITVTVLFQAKVHSLFKRYITLRPDRTLNTKMIDCSYPDLERNLLRFLSKGFTKKVKCSYYWFRIFKEQHRQTEDKPLVNPLIYKAIAIGKNKLQITGSLWQTLYLSYSAFQKNSFFGHL